MALNVQSKRQTQKKNLCDELVFSTPRTIQNLNFPLSSGINRPIRRKNLSLDHHHAYGPTPMHYGRTRPTRRGARRAQCEVDLTKYMGAQAPEDCIIPGPDQFTRFEFQILRGGACLGEGPYKKTRNRQWLGK